MFALKPVTITTPMLTSSISEPAPSETEWSAGTYVTGVRRINTTTNREYEVVANPSTTDDPLVGIIASPATWVDVGPTLRWAMFDASNNTKSVGDNLTVSLVSGLTISALSAIGIVNASEVNVTVVSAAEGEVYNVDIDMNDNSEVNDFYDYFFAPIINKDRFILNDLPFYSDGTIAVTFTGTAVGVGSLLIGREVILGITNYGSQLQSLNFGTVNEDAFGNVQFKKGNKARLVDFDVTIDTAKINYVFSQLQELTDTPTVWYATGTISDPTLVYGYHRDSRINISAPSISECTIQVRGLT